MSHPFTDDTAFKQLCDGVCLIAKQEIMSRHMHVSAITKADGSLLTEADTAMQHTCKTFLKQHYPDYGFLGEEMSNAEQQVALTNTQGCWVLDPVDGTSNFASNIPYFAVSLSLVVAGEVVVGLVYDPARDELFAARKNQGTTLNNAPLLTQTPKKTVKQCIAIADLKRLPAAWGTALVANPPFASQRSFGSVALDWCWIAAGRGQVYVHGSQNIWDYGAGWLILNEAGGASETFEGEAVFVAQVKKRSAIAATTPTLFNEWKAILQAIDKS